MKTALVVRALGRDDWPSIEELFGARGACGGCWCMLWRVPFGGGKEWKASLGEPNRAAFRKMIESGGVHGALAFEAGVPVGWCSIGPREDFPGLARKKKLQTDWDERTWSVTCFYIPAKHRGKGVATALLKEALRIAAAEGARAIEAYPVSPKQGSRMPAAFAWTGIPSLFERAGFRCITPNTYQPVYRRDLRGKRPAPAKRARGAPGHGIMRR